jgi:hypothetical protein
VSTDAAVWAAAPGQAAVFYEGDEVLGGGRIEVPARTPATVSPHEAREPALARA